MGEVRFMISEAAKQVKVESHVLRYWEEELDLKIGRTEMGHRYYTKDDIQLFRCIKKLKDEGMLLKDLKPIIPELKQTRLKLQNSAEPKAESIKKAAGNKPSHKGEENDSKDIKSGNIDPEPASDKPAAGDKPSDKEKYTNICKSDAQDKSGSLQKADSTDKSDKQDKPAVQETSSKETSGELSITDTEVIPATQLEQVRFLIGDVLTEVVTANNETLKSDLSQTVTKNVMREMDLLFQTKERQEEEHFRKLDCLIRQQQASRRETAREKPLGKLKKLFT
ncbi:helix-turn-helix domain-containing protein [Clostridium sp. C105KSO13]|uniref:helix-turn-helix domain-containing protein n=1 Tax=Clostridium sp. C105KSO13 TaxID=1776045 RepID=UPI00074058CF|nr:helix-turn-helix domain-containing protein [Clostridium sp. C105KSO13]CUX32717.1 zinc-responsive transcriptional regulator [Clostridium sp. C105KSO13]